MEFNGATSMKTTAAVKILRTQANSGTGLFLILYRNPWQVFTWFRLLHSYVYLHLHYLRILY